MSASASSSEAIDPASEVELSDDELLLLRLTCELSTDDESPLGPLQIEVDPERLENGARTLVRRGLADRRTYRPHREIVRRLLVVSEPDARVVLLHASPASAERVLDVYLRAGAYVAYRRSGNKHHIGPPLEEVDILDEVRTKFSPRRSTGDFIELQLTSAEYYALVCFAKELVLHGEASLGPKRPARSVFDPTMDGAVLMPGRRARFTPGEAAETSGSLAVPDEAAWQKALDALVAKDVLSKDRGNWILRSYLADLARGIATKTRFVLTRFDFGPGDWFVRDATLIPVPGSVFWLRTTANKGLAITEVDAAGLERAMTSAIDELQGRDTVDV